MFKVLNSQMVEEHDLKEFTESNHSLVFNSMRIISSTFE